MEKKIMKKEKEKGWEQRIKKGDRKTGKNNVKRRKMTRKMKINN